MAKLLPPTPDALARAASLLREGEVVGMPTETVYGLAGHALDPRALARIFAVKERPSFDPLIVHVPAPATMASLEGEGIVAPGWSRTAGGAVADRLAHRFWPGPLTLVLPRGPRIPDLATSGLDTVGVRAPAHPVARALLEAAGIPLAAPSANRFGRISPTSAAHVEEELGDRIPLILDGGETPMGIESTVLHVDAGGEVTLLRPGALPVEALEKALEGPVARGRRPADPLDGRRKAPASPGMLASHYAPGKRLHLLPAPLSRLEPGELAAALSAIRGAGPFGLLLQAGKGESLKRSRQQVEEALGEAGGPAGTGEAGGLPATDAAALLPGTEGVAARGTARNAVVETRALSPSGDPEEAARNLFSTLRALDGSPETAAILAEPAPGDEGLRHAINDRLRRAAIPPAVP